MSEMYNKTRLVLEVGLLRDLRFPVLDQGWVELCDAMTTELQIAEYARTTSQKEAKLPAEDIGLLRYLMRHRHTTPIEMAELVFRVHVPMDCWRQWIRHRTANVNEYSTRYSPAINEMAETAPDAWRVQSKSNRQGSSGDMVSEWPEGYTVAQNATNDNFFVVKDGSGCRDEFDHMPTPSEYLSSQESLLQKHARDTYNERLRFNVALELARKDLPLSTYTEAIWKVDLHNLFHFLGLRMDTHAQLEIRSYATIIGEQIVAKLYPNLWQAFLDYRLDALTLTALDLEVLESVVPIAPVAIINMVGEDYDCHDYLPESWRPKYKNGVLVPHRERDECLSKLQRLGLVRAD